MTLGYKVARLDVPTPADMRAPGAAQGSLPLEVRDGRTRGSIADGPARNCASVNYAERDANKNLPFSSKALRDCYREGAARFGWDKRPRRAARAARGAPN